MQKYIKTFLYCTLLCIYFVFLPVSAESITLRIPGNPQGEKVRNPYVDDLLHLIFEKQSLSLSIEYNRAHMSLGRSLKELANNNLIDLNWSVTSADREHQLHAIKIPIYQGLIGWRVFFIHQSNTIKFAQIKELSELQTLLAIQRFDWPDFEIMQSNGLNVEGNIPYENMHKAIDTGLADYFPRSVLEINREQSKYEELTNLMIEPKLLIKYPSSVYFFVNKENDELATIIEQGFNKAITDGSFAELFNKHFGAALEKLSLDQRRIINLNNPLISQ